MQYISDIDIGYNVRVNSSEDKETFAQYLNRKFREWEHEKGSHQTVSAFARFLGVKQPTLTRWMMGDSIPDLGNAQILAEKLGFDFYPMVGLVKPDAPMSPAEQEQVVEAMSRIKALMRSGVDITSPEGAKQVADIFSELGITLISTRQD